MTTDRRFAAFSKDAIPPRMKSMPESGMCISAFLVISKKGEPRSVLLGRINKKAEWDRIGAINGERLERFASGWMLPSSHLILFETPERAARRILREQLGIKGLKLHGPITFSDTGTAYFSTKPNHWDIGFVFTAEMQTPPSNEAWDELKFVDVNMLKPGDMVRSQEDVLAYAGKLARK